MEDAVDVDQLVDELIEREGGYVDHPADKGGPTCFGITEAVARAHNYRGAMRDLPREEAAAIYRRIYWQRPGFDHVAKRSGRVAAELFDTGVNMGPAVAATFLQRALTALNRNASDYPDLVPDGRVGGDIVCARHLLDGSRETERGNRPTPRSRGAAGRALPPPRRATAGQRSLPLWLVSEPYW
jgi:lysozyme family protein